MVKQTYLKIFNILKITLGNASIINLSIIPKSLHAVRNVAPQDRVFLQKEASCLPVRFKIYLNVLPTKSSSRIVECAEGAS